MAAEAEELASHARLDDCTAAHVVLDATDPLREFRGQFVLPTPATEENFDR